MKMPKDFVFGLLGVCLSANSQLLAARQTAMVVYLTAVALATIVALVLPH
jgi:hypothetical protein